MYAFMVVGRRLHTLRLLIIASLSLLLVVGCGSSSAKAPTPPITKTTPSATASSSATTTPPAVTTPVVASTLYTSTDGVFSLNYPADWGKQPLTYADTSSAVGLTSSDGNEVLLIFPVTMHIDASNYAAVAQSYLTQELKVTNVSLASSTGTITLPSGTWATLDGNGSFNGAAYDLTQLALDHGSSTFFMYVLTPNAGASTNVATYFAPMLRSFKFLK